MIPISSITSISPKNVAGSIPNAIEIFHAPLTASRNCNKTTTSSGADTNGGGEGQRSLFTTLPKRDHTMGILVDSWRKQAPEAYERYIQGDTSGELVKFGRSRSASTATTSSSVRGGAGGYESSDSSSSHSTVGGAGATTTRSQPKPTSSSDKSGSEQRGGGNTGGDGSTKGPHPATQADTPDLEKQAMHTRLPSEPKKVYELLYHKPEFLRGIWESEGMKGEWSEEGSGSRPWGFGCVLTNPCPPLPHQLQTSRWNPGPTANEPFPTPDPSVGNSVAPNAKARRPSSPLKTAKNGGVSRGRPGRPVYRQARVS